MNLGTLKQPPEDHLHEASVANFCDERFCCYKMADPEIVCLLIFAGCNLSFEEVKKPG